MKFFAKFLLLTVVAISLYNCNKDENESSDLVGQWRMTDIHTDDGISIFFGDTSTFMFQGTSYNSVTTFTENPNEFSTTGSYIYDYTTVTLGIPFTQTLTVNAFPGTGTWSINGDILTQVFGGSTTELEILELNDSTLRLKQNVDTNVTGVHNIATVYSSFEKI